MPTLVPLSGLDWTAPELDQIERLREFCNSTSNLKVDCGRSDEGCPWCVIHDDDAVVLHIARIDRAYIVATELKGIFCRSRNIENAADEALSELIAIFQNRPQTITAGR
jgi:hypothetical protein